MPASSSFAAPMSLAGWVQRFATRSPVGHVIFQEKPAMQALRETAILSAPLSWSMQRESIISLTDQFLTDNIVQGIRSIVASARI